MQHTGFTDAADALSFIMGGNATFTLTSAKTGTHFTFKATAPKNAPADATSPRFIKVLNGTDNSWNGDWMFIGTIQPKRGLSAGQKGRPDAMSFKALQWTLLKLATGAMPTDLTIQHSCKCGRCGRELTHPESVASGFGPECITKVGG